MEKLLEKEAPLVTTVSVIGALVASPMSMYTAKITDELKILTQFILQFYPFFIFDKKYKMTFNKYKYSQVQNGRRGSKKAFTSVSVLFLSSVFWSWVS